jgi:hypothetical protein
MEFVKCPNLPQNSVKTLILGQKYAEFLDLALKRYGISPIYVPDNPDVDERMSGHADLSVLHIGGARLICAKHLNDSEFSEKLTEIGTKLTFLSQNQGKKYPEDANLNICIIGNAIICNTASAEKSIVSYLTNNCCSIIPVRQGYSRCAVCVADERSIITADDGIANAAEKNGFAVLRVKPDLAELPGFEYGFIGGAAFKLDGGRLAFTGQIYDTVQRAAIEKFLRKRNIEPLYLTDERLRDIGGAIPITEKT